MEVVKAKDTITSCVNFTFLLKIQGHHDTQSNIHNLNGINITEEIISLKKVCVFIPKNFLKYITLISTFLPSNNHLVYFAESNVETDSYDLSIEYL